MAEGKKIQRLLFIPYFFSGVEKVAVLRGGP